MNNIQILVVDDDPDVLLTTCRILKSEGYRVISTSSAREGLKLVKQKPDLVLLDVNMPELNGFEICQKIKSDPELTDVFVVMISGVMTKPEHQVSGLNLGADGYLLRPITRVELTARINSFLRISAILKQIRNSEKWLETTINSIDDSVIITDDKGKITFLNRAAEKLTGRNMVDLIDLEADQVLRLHDISTDIPLENPVAAMIGSSDNIKRLPDCLLKRQDENSIYVKVTFTAILSFKTGSSGIVITVQDINDRKKAELELVKYQLHLEELVKERIGEVLEKNRELEHYHELFIGREFRIKELRDQVKDLETKLSDFKR
ncbi:MAG: response regulator [Candidatus Cloacimonetes bacterium]|nr:response regulator [Candidatus Cloacimonadota bacterium]